MNVRPMLEERRLNYQRLALQESLRTMDLFFMVSNFLLLLVSKKYYGLLLISVEVFLVRGLCECA